MSFSFSGAAGGQVSETPAVCDRPRLLSCPQAEPPPHSLRSPPLGSALPFPPVSIFCLQRHSGQLLALKRNLFIALRNKPSHVLFLMGFKCLFYKRKVLVEKKPAAGASPGERSVGGPWGAGGREKQVWATSLWPHRAENLEVPGEAEETQGAPPCLGMELGYLPQSLSLWERGQGSHG